MPLPPGFTQTDANGQPTGNLPPGFTRTDANFQVPNSSPKANAPQNGIGAALSGLAEGAGEVGKGALESIGHPINAVKSIWSGMKAEADASAKSLNRGDLVEGLSHAIGIVPVLGPAFDKVLEGIGDEKVDDHEFGRRVGQALTLEIAPDVVRKGVEVAPTVAKVPRAAVEAAKTATPDIVKGAVKAGAGAAAAEVLPGPLRMVGRVAGVYPGARQMIKGATNGAQAFREALAPETEAQPAATSAAPASSQSPSPNPPPQNVAPTKPVFPRYPEGAQSPLVNAYETAPEATKPLFQKPEPTTTEPPASPQTPETPAPTPRDPEVLDAIARNQGVKGGYASLKQGEPAKAIIDRLYEMGKPLTAEEMALRKAHAENPAPAPETAPPASRQQIMEELRDSLRSQDVQTDIPPEPAVPEVPGTLETMRTLPANSRIPVAKAAYAGDQTPAVAADAFRGAHIANAEDAGAALAADLFQQGTKSSDLAVLPAKEQTAALKARADALGIKLTPRTAGETIHQLGQLETQSAASRRAGLRAINKLKKSFAGSQ